MVPRQLVVPLILLWISSSFTFGEERLSPDADRPPDALRALQRRQMEGVVKMAVLEAYRRLDDPRCRGIFTDFRDLEGRSLQENLDSIGQTGQSFLAWMLYFDGIDRNGCAPDVLAFTSVGSRILFFCGDRFRHRLERRGLGTLAILVLHEELHALGLGENPPASDEITRRIESRCGT